MLAFIAAGAWQIVTGDETEPALGNHPTDTQFKQHKSFITRRGHAIAILSGSVNPVYRGQIMAFAQDCAVDSMWDKLKESDQTTSAVYVNSVRQSFLSETFDPTKQTIRQFVGKLQNWANRISTAERNINEDEIHEKLLNSLPSDSLWQTAKMFCLQQSLGLAESINLLSSNEKPPAQESAASAKDESRGRKGGKDNQGRGSGSKRKGRKDTVKEQSSRHDSRRRRRNSRSPSRSPSRSYSRSCSRSRSHSPQRSVRCYFCDKKGHRQKDCPLYKKAQRQAQRKEESGDDKSKDKPKAKESAQYSYANADDYNSSL
jgi:gag-polypeptide of LTR copia-type/Zinc knuckle